MSEAKGAAPRAGPRKRRSWLRVPVTIFGFIVIALGAFYIIISSPGFLKNHILPRISKDIGATVTVSSGEIHPFSRVVLRDLKIQSTNQATLLTAHEVRFKCNLLDILSGNFRIDEAVLVSPVFQLVQNPDGTSNLDPITKAAKTRAKQKSNRPSETSKPIQVDLRKLILSDATIRRIQNHKVGTGDLVEFTNLDLTLADFRNNGSGKLEFSCVVRDENNPPAPAMYGLLRANIEGSFDFTLASNLQPNSVVGDAHLKISQAAGSFSDFAKLDGALHGDVSATEFKSVTLNFEKEGSRLGELRATGPYNASKAEGRLNVELLSVDKQVLNLFGARYGIDFGSTTITSTNTLELTNAGAAIAAAGQLRASRFQLGRTNESTPPLELRADYNVSVDKAARTAFLRNFNVTGAQNGRPLLRGELTSPMTLAWGNTTNEVGDSSLNLTVTKLNIADWKAFAGNLASSGTLDLNMKLLSQEGGTKLTFDTTNRIEGLTADVGGQHIADTTVLLKARGRSTDFKLFDLKEYNLQLLQSNQPALVLSGSGTYDRTNSDADLQIDLETSIPRAIHVLNHDGLMASSGTAELRGHVTQIRRTQTVTGNLTLAKFTGKVGKSEFRNFGATMDLDVEKTPAEIDFHQVTGSLSGDRNSGGDFKFSGLYNLANKPSQFAMTFSNFNQDGLRPLLEPLFVDKRLVSISMNGKSSIQINPRASSAVQADIQVSNLVVSDPAQQSLSAPLDAGVKFDAALRKQIADIHQLEITLTPTQRATNRFQLQGRIDASGTNYLQGDLTLTSDSLDLTSYYDLFAATNKPAAKPAGNSRNKNQNQPAPPPRAPKEAATNHLPFANFTLAANVKRFYLREIDASNLQATVKLDGSHVLLKPFQLTMAGSPVLATADIDMSVPGWKYAFTVNGSNAPYAPLWNTFNPDRKDEVSGTVTAHGNINGIGTAGESLQKSLSGNFYIETTNLNLQVTAIRSRLLLNVIGIVANVRDLLESPLSALSIAANIVRGNFRGHLSDEINNSPIETIVVKGTAGNGRVTLQKALVRSSAFEAMTTNGEITLAPELTNSAINIPVQLGVGSAITGRISFLHLNNVQTNGAYLRLPDFLSETGTISDPKPSPNVIALTKSTIQELTNAIIGTNGVLARPIQGIGDLLKGGTNSNAPPTNQPATNPPATNTLSNRKFRPITR